MTTIIPLTGQLLVTPEGLAACDNGICVKVGGIYYEDHLPSSAIEAALMQPHFAPVTAWRIIEQRIFFTAAKSAQ